MAKTKTYKVGNEVYDIPENEANEFLSNFKDAIEVESFIVDKDTFDIPLAETQEFKTQFPTAQPLKKNFGTEPTQTDGKIGGTSGATAVQSTESETGLFAPMQVPKMFAEKTLKVKETPAPKGKYTLEREGQLANVSRDDIFKNIENEEFLKGVKSGEVKVDIQDDEALGELLNDKLSFYKPKETYAIDGQEVSQQQMTEKLYDRDFVNKLQQDQVKLEFPETDTFIADLTQKQKQSGGELMDKWESIKEGAYRMASGVAGMQNFVKDAVRLIPIFKDMPETITEKVSEAAANKYQKLAQQEASKIRQYESDFVSSIENGNYLDALNQATNVLSASTLPIAATMVTGGASGMLPMAAIYASGEYAGSEGQEKLSGEKLTQGERIASATISGTAESVLGVFPTSRIVSKQFPIFKEAMKHYTKKAMGIGGKEAAEKFAQEASKKTVMDVVKDVFKDPALEVAGETANEAINITKDIYLGIRNPTNEEIKDELINIAALSYFTGQTLNIPSSAKSIKKYIDQRVVKSPNTVKDSIKKKAKVGDITESEMEVALSNVDKRVDAINAVPADLQENVEIIDLVQQKKELEEQAKNLDPIFQGQAQEKISELESEIVKLVNQKISIPTAEIKDLAQRIANGEKIESAEDLQLQANYPKELEQELITQKQEAEKPTKTIEDDLQIGDTVELEIDGVKESDTTQEVIEPIQEGEAETQVKEGVGEVVEQVEQEQLLTPKIEQDAKKQQDSPMREQSVQEQPQRESDSDMPIVNEAELQDGKVVEEEVMGREIQPKAEDSGSPSEAKAKIKSDFDKDFGEQTTVVGSVARGEAKQDSDIDIVIEGMPHSGVVSIEQARQNAEYAFNKLKELSDKGVITELQYKKLKGVEHKALGITFKYKGQEFQVVPNPKLTKPEAKPESVTEEGKEEVTQEEIDLQQEKETQYLLNGEAQKRRSAGKFIKDGIEYVRNKVNKGIRGNKGVVKFAEGVPDMPFTYKLVEAEELQPSHSQGYRNPMHFIPEAQPKNRNDEGSKSAEMGFANEPRFKELGENTNAYSGAPVVNERSEVVQGNNRAAGLKIGYNQGNSKYKNDLADNAEKFGFSKEQVLEMKNPILVREVAFSDEGAIEFGNYDAKDLETGGKGRIDPIALVKRIPIKAKAQLTALLFKDDLTLNNAIRNNEKEVLGILTPYLNTSQRTTLIKDGELSARGVQDIEAVVQQFLFDNGDMALPDLFENLSHKQKEGIRKSLPFIFSAGIDANLIPEIQNAILALNQYDSSGIRLFDSWLTQADAFTDNKSPKEIYTPQEIAIARVLNDAKSQIEIVNKFKDFSAAVEGVAEKPATLLDEATPAIKGKTKEQALNEIFKIKKDEGQQEGDKRSGKKADKKTTKKEQSPEEIAKRIRDKKNRGAMVALDFGISKTVYNGALEFMAKQVEKGTKLGNAIANTIKWIDGQVQGVKWNKGAFAKYMNDTYTMKLNDGRTVEVVRDDTKQTAQVINGWYQPIEQKVLDTKQETQPANKWAEQLRSKEDEDLWTGVREFLESKGTQSVSKKELLDFMKDNRVEIVEVVKGQGSQLDKFDIEFDKDDYVVTRNGIEERRFSSGVLANDYIRKKEVEDATKFSQYQLEGEKENYKEVLVTLPRKLSKEEKRFEELRAKDKLTAEESTEFAELVNDDVGTKYGSTKDQFKSTHFEEPNILVHLRMNTRTDAQGNKVLFLEEVQSDWGQKGKKEGFKGQQDLTPIKIQDDRFDNVWKVGNGTIWNDANTFDVRQGDKIKTFDNYEDAVKWAKENNQELNKIPTAPFVTDTNAWTKLGLKLALKEAVAQGVDKIAWSTGTQQFDRWGSEEISWRKNTARTPQEEARMKELGEKIVNYKDTNEERVEHEKLARKEGGFSLLINEQTSGATAFNGQESGNKDDVTIQSKEDLRKAIKKNLSRERNDAEIDKLTDRIWNRMQTEDSGTSLPRKEGMEEFYGNPADMERAKNFTIKKEGELFAVKDEKGKTVRTFKQENEANKFKENYGLGIVGNVAKSLFKQEPKTINLTLPPIKGFFEPKEPMIGSTQHSIDITPELKASVEGGLPLFGTNLTERQQLEENVKQAEAELKKAREDRNKQGKNLGVIFDPQSQAEADIKVLSKLKDYVVAKLQLGAYDIKTFFADMKRMGIEVSKDTEQKWNEWFDGIQKTAVKRGIDKETGVTRPKPTEQKRIDKAYAWGVADTFKKFNDLLDEMASDFKEMNANTDRVRKELRTAIRESKLGFTSQQVSKILGIVEQTTTKNFDGKLQELKDYLETIRQNKEEAERKAKVKEVKSDLNPKSYTSLGTSKRAKTRISESAKQQLISLGKAIGDQIETMNLTQLNQLQEIIDNIVEEGKQEQSAIQKFLENARRIANREMTKNLSEKAGRIKPISGKSNILNQLKDGNLVIINGNIYTKRDASILEEQDESYFNNATLVGTVEVNQYGTKRPSVKSFVYRKTDFLTMLNALMPKGKEAKQWFENNIINPIIDASNSVLEDRVKFGDKIIEAKTKAFGKGKSAKILSKQTGLSLKDINGNDVVEGGITNDMAVYIYNVLKDPLMIDKAFNSRFNKDQLIQIINYVNSNPQLKKYAEEVVNLYKDYLPKVNNSLIENGYDSIVPGEYTSLKNKIAENSGQAGQDKIDNITTEIKDLKNQLSLLTDPLEITKKQDEISKKEKALSNLKNSVESINAKAEIMEAIYGDISNMPLEIPYTPARVGAEVGQEFNMDDMFSTGRNVVSAMADNVIERTKGGSLRVIGNEQMMESYRENMINMANKLTLYRNLFSMFQQGQQNMRLIESMYGSKFAQDFQGLMQDIVMEKNTTKVPNNWVIDYVNRSAGLTMFFNLRSAVFQLLSMPNYMVEAMRDGVMIDATANFFKQFTDAEIKDAKKEIMESGWFRDRINRTHSPELDDLRTAKGKSLPTKVLDDLIEKGYFLTQLADSYGGIMMGGAPYYASVKKKLYNENLSKGMSSSDAMEKAKKDAMDKMSFVSNKTQQSQVPLYMSEEQKNPISRMFLTFGSVNALYTREMIRAISDYKNKRISAKEAVGVVAYYAVAQQMVFLAIQQGLTAVLASIAFSDDEEEKLKEIQLAKKKSLTIANQTVNSFLRGFGVYGAGIAAAKDLVADITTLLAKDTELAKEYKDLYTQKRDKIQAGIDFINQLAPNIGIKINKAIRAVRDLEKYQKEQEVQELVKGVAKGTEAITNIPTGQLVRVMDYIQDMQNDYLTLTEKIMYLMLDYETLKEARDKQKKEQSQSTTKQGSTLEERQTTERQTTERQATERIVSPRKAE